MQSFASQGNVGPYIAVAPQEAGLVGHYWPAIAEGTQVHLLELTCSPQPHHQDVGMATLASFLTC
jgi:hypothetical protein